MKVAFQWWVYISCQLLSNVSKKMGGGHECGCLINFSVIDEVTEREEII